MNLTHKQRTIIDTVMRANPDGSWLDVDQLILALPYETTKDSLQFSIRALLKRGLIERKSLEFRRGQQRRIIAPTGYAYELFHRS